MTATRPPSKPEPAAADAPRLQPPPGQEIWVFGYGSLMWLPGFPHQEVRAAHLHGYHRHFCVYSHVYRGTPERPGLVLGLDRGGSCRGLAYRVSAAEGDAALDYLYRREMVTGVYRPRWLRARTAQGPIAAAAFVIDPDHAQYAGRLPGDRMVELILQGSGRSGACIDYLENTVRQLQGFGLRDRSLEGLLARVLARRLPPEAHDPG